MSLFDLRNVDETGRSAGVRTALDAARRQGLTVTSINDVLVNNFDRTVVDVSSSADRYVIKVDNEPDRWRAELAGMRFAMPLVPIADVIFTEPGPPTVLAYRYVEGEALIGRNDDAAWRAAGAMLAQFHNAQYSECDGATEGWSAHLLGRAQWECDAAKRINIAEPGLLQDARAVLVQGFANLALDRCSPLHGDCQATHILMNADPARPEVVGIIDLADFGCGDPIIDLTTLTAWRPEKMLALLDGYQPDATLLARLVKAERAYRLLRFIGVARWRAERDLDSTRHIDAARELVLNR